MAEVGKRVEGVSFLFFVFLLYMFFLFLRPMDLFAPWLAQYRPMVVIWLIAFVGGLIEVNRDRNGGATAKHYWILAGMWVGVVLSLVAERLLGEAVEAFTDFSNQVLLFMLISFHLRSIERLRKAAFVIVISLTVLSVFGIVAYHTGYKAEELVLQQRKDDWTIEAPETRPPVPALDESGAFMWRVRGVGFLADPNDLAQALIMTLPMLMWFWRKGARLRNLVFVGAPGAIMVYCITITNSRGAILGIAALMFLGVRRRLGNVRTLMLMGVAGAGAMVVGMTGGRAISSKERSAEERIEAWHEGIQMLKQNPVFGIGYGRFVDHHYLTAHNSFVLGFSELGLFGYTFWIASLVMAFVGVSRVANFAPEGSDENLAGNILRSSLVGYFTCAWFLSRTYQPVLYALMALCAAAWVCARRSEACANIPQLQAPMDIFNTTLKVTLASIAGVYMFVLLHHL